MFLSASVGFCALTAIIRAFRGEGTLFFVEMSRVVFYIYLPASLIIGAIFITQGMSMTFQRRLTSEIRKPLQLPGSLPSISNAKPSRGLVTERIVLVATRA
jgi:K+-transporting ATPase A subunit